MTAAQECDKPPRGEYKTCVGRHSSGLILTRLLWKKTLRFASICNLGRFQWSSIQASKWSGLESQWNLVFNQQPAGNYYSVKKKKKKATPLLPATCLNKLVADDVTEIRLHTDALGVPGVKNREGPAFSASLNKFYP